MKNELDLYNGKIFYEFGKNKFREENDDIKLIKTYRPLSFLGLNCQIHKKLRLNKIDRYNKKALNLLKKVVNIEIIYKDELDPIGEYICLYNGVELGPISVIYELIVTYELDLIENYLGELIGYSSKHNYWISIINYKYIQFFKDIAKVVKVPGDQAFIPTNKDEYIKHQFIFWNGDDIIIKNNNLKILKNGKEIISMVIPKNYENTSNVYENLEGSKLLAKASISVYKGKL